MVYFDPYDSRREKYFHCHMKRHMLPHFSMTAWTSMMMTLVSGSYSTKCTSTALFSESMPEKMRFPYSQAAHKQLLVSNVLQSRSVSFENVIGYISTVDYILVYSLSLLGLLGFEYLLFRPLFKRTHVLSYKHRMIVIFVMIIYALCFVLVFLNIFSRIDAFLDVICHTKAWIAQNVNEMKRWETPHTCLSHLQGREVVGEWLSYMNTMSVWNDRMENIASSYRIGMWFSTIPHGLVCLPCVSIFLMPRFVKNVTFSIFFLQLTILVSSFCICFMHEFSQDVAHALEHLAIGNDQVQACARDFSTDMCHTLHQCRMMPSSSFALNASFSPLRHETVLTDDMILAYGAHPYNRSREKLEESFGSKTVMEAASNLYANSNESFIASFPHLFAVKHAILPALENFGNVSRFYASHDAGGFSEKEWNFNITHDASLRSYTCAISAVQSLSMVTCDLFTNTIYYEFNGLNSLWIHFWMLICLNLLFTLTSTIFLKMFLTVKRQMQVNRVRFNGAVAPQRRLVI